MSEVPLYSFASEWIIKGPCLRLASTACYDCMFQLWLIALCRCRLFPRRIPHSNPVWFACLFFFLAGLAGVSCQAASIALFVLTSLLQLLDSPL